MTALAVVDGTSLLFRAYFGGAQGHAPDGTPTGAARAVCQRLSMLLRQRGSGGYAVVFDAGPKTFRNDLEPLYKADRGEPPEDLVPQVDMVKGASEQLGFATWSLPGFEADDLMATLAHIGHRAGLNVDLYTVDKDVAQAVTDGPPPVVQIDLWTGKRWDEAAVVDRMGVTPAQMVDYQALVGDSTDNLAGVKGIGPKTAVALLQHFGTLDALYERLDEVVNVKVRGAKTLGAKLDAGRQAAVHTRAVVRLVDDVKLGVDAAGLAAATDWHGPLESARGFFDGLGFGGMLERFGR